MVHNSVTWPRRDFTLSSTHFYCIFIVNLHFTYLLDLGCINSFREHFTLISFKIVRTFTFVFENECFCNTSPFNHNIFNSFAKFGTFPTIFCTILERGEFIGEVLARYGKSPIVAKR